MSMAEIEATIWCPTCRKEMFRVLRIPTETEGVFTHEIEAIEKGVDAATRECPNCGGNLERKSEP